jgi:serine/threonine protein kinase
VSVDVEREAARILELGMTTPERVEEARRLRERLRELGLRPRPLADILYEKGWIEEEHRDALRREQTAQAGREQIAGYRLTAVLGEGAMGTVYRAKQLSLDRDVAIKVLSPELADDPVFVERFLREAKAVARLNHTNIVSGIDVGEADGLKYFVMEHVDGNTVAFLLRRGGAIDEERALLLAQQVARALDHAYRNGLVHRDVKPENVLISRDGVAKLCDLGLAKLEDHGPADAARMGTPSYISPEQARGEADVDIRSDLYSLGATLFHMLTGRPPFAADTPALLLAKHLTEAAPSPRTLAPEVSPATETVVLRLLAKQPSERYQTPAELLKALEETVRSVQAARGAVSAAAPAPVAPQPPKAPAPAPVVVRRRRR